MATERLENGTRIIVVRLTAKTGLSSFDFVVETALKEARVPTQHSPFVSAAFSIIEIKHTLSGVQYAAWERAISQSRIVA